MTSVLSGVFPEHTVIFNIAPYPQEPEHVVLTVQLEQIRNPALRQQLGVNTGEIALRIYLVNPVRAPEGITPDLEAPLTLAGVEGRVKLLPWLDEDPEVVTDALGEILYGVWRG